MIYNTIRWIYAHLQSLGGFRVFAREVPTVWAPGGIEIDHPQAAVFAEHVPFECVAVEFDDSRFGRVQVGHRVRGEDHRQINAC